MNKSYSYKHLMWLCLLLCSGFTLMAHANEQADAQEKQPSFSLKRVCPPNTNNDELHSFNTECKIIRTKDGVDEELISYQGSRLHRLKKLTDQLYYFYISCGSPCGYSHYVTHNDFYVAFKYSEVLYNKERNCLIEAKDRKIYTVNLLTQTKKEIFDFDAHKKYQTPDYDEVFALNFNLAQLIKEDTYLDDNNRLHVYLVSKDADMGLDNYVAIDNVCQ